MDAQFQLHHKFLVCTHETRLYTHIDMCLRKHIKSNIEIKYAGTGRSIIKLTQITLFDAMFIDVGLVDISCMELVEYYRGIDPEIVIFLLIEKPKDALLGYEFDVFRCLEKATLYTKLESCVPALMKELGINRDHVEFKVANRIRRVYTDEILYAESQLHTVFIHYRGRRQEPSALYGTLAEVEKMLTPYGFFRIHNSYIINIEYCVEIIDRCAVLINGIKLPISRNTIYELRDVLRTKGKGTKHP